MIYLNTKLYKSNYIITMKDIVKEDNEMLYKKTKPLEIPLSDNDFTLLNNMMIFLKNSQIIAIFNAKSRKNNDFCAKFRVYIGFCTLFTVIVSVS